MQEKNSEKELPFVDESLFPKSSSLLHEERYVRSISFVSGSPNKTEWRSKLDELFCHIVFRFDPPRLKYYQKRGQPLHELLRTTPRDELAKLDNLLVKALDLALRRSRLRIKRRKHGWAAFVADFMEEQRLEKITTLLRQ